MSTTYEAVAPLLVVSHITVRFGGLKAIDDVSFNLFPGELLGLIGKKRGAVMGGGRINMQKAAELLITDFRTQMIGRITLETPPEFEQWRAAGEAAEAAAKARKAEHEKHRKAGRKRY